MIANIVREKRIDLSYPIQIFDLSKEIAAVSLFTDNIQCEFWNHWIDLKPRSKQIKAETYTRRKLIDLVEGKTELTQFDKDPQIKRMNMLEGITEVALNLNKLKDGKLSNILLRYHVTGYGDYVQFEPNTPQYQKLMNGKLVSLALNVMYKNNIIADGPVMTVVLHIR